MGIIFSILGAGKKFLTVVAKLCWFFGVVWLLLPVAIGLIIELATKQYIEGTFIEKILDLLWYAAYVLCPLMCIQNLIRVITKSQEFSWIRLITKQQPKKGFEAKLGGNTVALKAGTDLSGVVFGKLGDKYATMPETTDGHILIIGGVGSGKTAAFAIPTLMSWKARVFAIDIKGELYAKTRKARGNAQIKAFNPTDREACGYDPFFMLRHTDNISNEARSLALSICPLPAEVKDPFWIKGAQNMLTGFIVYLFGQGLNFAETMKFIKSQPVKNLVSLVMADTEPTAERAKLELSQFDGMDDKTLSGVFAELSNHITIFATDDNLQRALSGNGDFITPADLENGYDIYCCIPENLVDVWKDLLAMMCNQFLKFFECRSEDNDTPILFFIDEFPRLGKIESINNGLATLRSKKIHIALIAQSKSQLNVNYGKNASDVIMDTCSYKAILGTGDADMQDYCSKLVGTYEQVKVSSNYNADIMGVGKGQGTSQTTEEKRIIKPEEFSYLGDDVVCLFPSGYKRLKKASCYEIGSPFFKKLPPEVQEKTRKMAAEAKKNK